VSVHVIPVPRGYTPEQAWDEIDTLGALVEARWWKPRFWFPRWAVVVVDE
jgi:hypothetical protein